MIFDKCSVCDFEWNPSVPTAHSCEAVLEARLAAVRRKQGVRELGLALRIGDSIWRLAPEGKPVEGFAGKKE